jgi:hypothetical protein
LAIFELDYNEVSYESDWAVYRIITSTDLSSAEENDFIIVKDSSTSEIKFGGYIEKVGKVGNKYYVWIRSNDLEFLKGKEVYVGSDIVEYEINLAAREMVDTAEVKLSMKEDVLIEEEAEIVLGGEFVLGGYVKNKRNEIGLVNVSMNSWADIFNRVYVNKVYYSQDVADIVDDLIESYTNLTCEYYPATGTGIVLDKFVAKDYLMDVLQRLAELVNYQLRIQGTTINFEPEGYQSASFTITNTNSRIDKWIEKRDKMVNDLYLIGSVITYRHHDTATGDGTTTEFTLTYKPKGAVEVYVGGVLQDKDSYEVDDDAGKITFDTAPGSSVSIDFYYTYEKPVYLNMSEGDSIERYGLYAKKERALWIKDIDTAKRVAKQFLSQFKEPERVTKVIMNIKQYITSDVRAGKMVTVNDLRNKVSGSFIVKVVKLKNGIAELQIGSLMFNIFEWAKKIQERLRLLELEHLAEDILTKYYYFKEKINVIVKLKKISVYKNVTLGGAICGLVTCGEVTVGTIQTTGWQLHYQKEY